jgi:hypothetical protein
VDLILVALKSEDFVLVFLAVFCSEQWVLINQVNAAALLAKWERDGRERSILWTSDTG